MRPADLPEFSALLDATCQLLSRGTYAPSDVATGMFFRALRHYGLDEVRAALDAHVADPKHGAHVPVPADVIRQISREAEEDGRPGVEEAWAIALTARDEADTVVWTAEVAQAWSAAHVVYAQGDEVGARMTFKEVYTRLVVAAREARTPHAWVLAEGHDIRRCADAVRRAAAIGRRAIGADDVLALPAPRGEVPLLVAPNVGMPTETRAALMALSARLAARQGEPSRDAEARERTARLQRETLERVAQYGLAHGIPLMGPAKPGSPE